MSIDLTTLTRAVSLALIDVRTHDGEWEAIGTDYRQVGRVIVTLRHFGEPLACTCSDPESEEIDENCELCLFGCQPEPDYYEFEVTIADGGRA